VIGAVPQPLLPTSACATCRKGDLQLHPGAQFGIYRPDTFWFAEGARWAKLMS
jgi:hypothetical protein